MIDTSINLGGREVKLKPTHKAIFKIEDECGYAVYDLLVERSLRTKDICIIFYHCAVAAGEKVTQDEIGASVVGNLNTETVLKAKEILASVFGKSENKEEKEESSKKNHQELSV